MVSNQLREQQGELTSTWDLMLQTRINLSRSAVRMMMDSSNQQSNAKVELLDSARKTLAQAATHYKKFKSMAPLPEMVATSRNIDEKYNIIIYKQRMNILAYENNLIEKEKELIPNKKSLEKEAKRLLESCNLKINSLNKTVDTLEKGKEKLDKFTSEKKLGNGYTTIQLLALNKITKGEYNKVFFEAKKISKDINNLEKELSQTSKVNFIKRSSISKDIETLKINYNKCKSSEENLLKKYKDSDYLKDVSFTIDKCLNTAKKRVEKENKSLKEDRNIQYLIKRKLNEIVGLEREFKPYTKNKPIQIQKDLKHTLGGLKKALVQDKKPNQNNLEIKLQKEKEGWEL